MSRTEKYTTIPTWLKHKPIYVLNKKEHNNTFYENDTDVIGFSLGVAQWENDSFQPSVKVWRDVKIKGTNKYKISRQSEETTITRAIDLAMLVVRIYDCYANNKNIENQVINTMFGEIKLETIGTFDMLQNLKNYFNNKNLLYIKEHIKILKDIINETKI